MEAVHGKRPFEHFANQGWSDLARARLLEEKAQRDDYAIRLHTVEGPYRCKPFTLRPRARPYVFGSSRLCEIWFLHEQIADEALSITATSDDRVLVSNPGRQVIRLGHGLLGPGESAPWPRLALLQVGPCVFALEDPLAVALEESALQPNVVMTTFAPESSS